MSKAAVSGACRLVKSRIEDITLCDFKLYYKATVIKIARLPQNRNIDQRNRVESPEINSVTHCQFTIKRLSKYNSEDTIFNKWHWENWDLHPKNETDSSLTLLTKIKWKWIKDKCKTWNHKNPRRKYRGHALWHCSRQWFLFFIFLDMTPKAQSIAAKINKWDYDELKILCTTGK